MIFDTINSFISSTSLNGKLIALDFGQAKIGIATSDLLRSIANAHSIYHRRTTRQDIGYLADLAAKEQACAIIIGLPLELDGSEGENCKNVRNFANKLHKKTNLPILLADERLSTAAATRALSEEKMTRKKRQSLDDKVAAAFILQGVLDSI